jgi:tetratricopeptide (TPR) repeat protein
LQVRSALDSLTSSGLLRHVPGTETEYVFHHVLIQEAAYASPLHRARRDIHRAVARIYEETYRDRLDEFAGLLAHHVEHAGAPDQAIDYLWRAGEFALRRSAFAEAGAALTHAYALLPVGDPRRVALLVRRGDVLLYQSEYSNAGALLQDALTAARQTGDTRMAAAALSGLARVASQLGNHAEARQRGEEAVSAARACSDPAMSAMALRRLAIANDYLGDLALAIGQLGESLAIYRRLGDQEGISGCLNSLGILSIEQGDFEQAGTYLKEALEISRARGDLYAVGTRLANLGTVADKLGDLPLAENYQQQALALAQQIGDREGVALITLNLGSLSLKRGDASLAFARFRAALSDTMALRSYSLALYVIAAVADADVKQGRCRQGAALLGFVLGQPGCTGDIRLDFAPTLEALRTAMPAAELAELMDGAQTQTLADVATQILSEK